MTNDEKSKIIEKSIEYRKKDIAERQIDIDNYIESLRIIDEEYKEQADVFSYRPHLESLLKSALLEQTKVKIFLAAAEANLAKLKP